MMMRSEAGPAFSLRASCGVYTVLYAKNTSKIGLRFTERTSYISMIYIEGRSSLARVFPTRSFGKGDVLLDD